MLSLYNPIYILHIDVYLLHKYFHEVIQFVSHWHFGPGMRSPPISSSTHQRWKVVNILSKRSFRLEDRRTRRYAQWRGRFKMRRAVGTRTDISMNWIESKPCKSMHILASELNMCQWLSIFDGSGLIIFVVGMCFLSVVNKFVHQSWGNYIALEISGWQGRTWKHTWSMNGRLCHGSNGYCGWYR